MSIVMVQSFADSLSIMHKLMADDNIARHKRACFIEAYQNGREQGILVWGFRSGNAFFVANHRNGDHPRIHYGEYSMQGVSEDAYKHQHNFQSIEDAAAWLVDSIIVELDKNAS